MAPRGPGQTPAALGVGFLPQGVMPGSGARESAAAVPPLEGLLASSALWKEASWGSG